MLSKRNVKRIFTALLILSIFINIKSGLFLYVEGAESGESESSEESGEANGSNGESEGTDEVTGPGENTFALGGSFPATQIMSEAVYVFETRTNTLVYSRNENRRIYPASTIKIMTTLVVLNMIEDINLDFTLDCEIFYPTILSAEFVGSDPNFVGVAHSGFDHTQTNLTVRDALYGLMLPSGCDAANMLAFHFGEGEGIERVNNFIERMNTTGRDIGMTGTNFTNAHGLFEPNNYSTVYDLFLLTKYAFDRHSIVFADLVAETRWDMPPNALNSTGYPVENTNYLLRESSPYFYDFVSGVKTGGLPYIRRQNSDGTWGEHLPGTANLVSIAQRDGFEYIIVTAAAPWHPSELRQVGERGLHHAFNDHRALYSWAFSTFDYRSVLGVHEPIQSVRVLDGERDTINLFPQMTNEEEFHALLPHDIDSTTDIFRRANLDYEEITAPVEAGTILGYVELVFADRVIQTFPLITIDSIEKTHSATLRSWIRDMFFTPVLESLEDGEIDEEGNLIRVPTGEYRLRPLYVFILVLISVLIIALIVLSYIRKHKKQSRERRVNRRKPPNRRIRR
ncbi:MAG: hypothetical protein FWF76_01140 [Oscillospiraceae bacterium]|nr:hypothetical protein [Oscillospiraceae bacterium]